MYISERLDVYFVMIITSDASILIMFYIYIYIYIYIYCDEFHDTYVLAIFSILNDCDTFA